MYGNVLQNPAAFALLLHIDNELAEETSKCGCRDPECKGRLSPADFPRKPRGVPPPLEDGYSFRFSFTCGRCKLRTTPPSVRFLYRKLYVAAVVLLTSPPEGTSIGRLSQQLGIPRCTLLRWRRWWTQEFLSTDCWKELRTRFMPPLVGKELPLNMLERCQEPSPEERLAKTLRLISPVSVCPPKGRKLIR